MTAAGRPLRFLGTVLGGWTLARVWLLWPTIDSVPALIHAVVPAVAATTHGGSIVATVAPAPARPPRPAGTATMPRPGTIPALGRRAEPGLPEPAPTPRRGSDIGAFAVAASTRYGSPAPVAIATDPVRRSRFSGSGWLLLRGAGPAGAAPGGQLGGAQGGVRLSYAIDGARRLSLNARFSAPLRGNGREIGLGLAWRPTRAPVTLLAETRLPLDGGRPAPAISVIGGINPTPVAAGFRLEGYGQAGAIRRDRIESFADGFLRLAHPLTTGALAIDLGAGAWGGAQTGASRLDLGPSLGMTLPPIHGRRLRATLDWRERIVGRARPGSGVALALGADF